MINIAYAASPQVCTGLALSIISLLYYNSECNIYVMELSDENFRFNEAQYDYLKNLVSYMDKKSTITFINCDILNETILANGGANKSSGFTPLANLRLVLDRVTEVDNILYLDCDTVINGSIIEDYYNNLSYDISASYCNSIGTIGNELVSGVLFFNLKSLRKTQFFNEAIKFLIKNKLKYPDQMAIEYSAKTCNIKLNRLPQEFGFCNELSEVEDETHLKIIHCTNKIKKIYTVGADVFFRLYPQFNKFNSIIKKFNSCYLY